MKKTIPILICTAGLLLLSLAANPARAAEYSRKKAAWYIGFSAGGGGTWLSGSTKDTANATATLTFDVGQVLNPNFLLGFKMILSFNDALKAMIDGSQPLPGNTAKKQVALPRMFIGVMVTYYPLEKAGFYFKAGPGLGLTSKIDTPNTHVGIDIKFATGWEFQIGKTFNLGFEMMHGVLIYSSEKAYELLLHTTLRWY